MEISHKWGYIIGLIFLIAFLTILSVGTTMNSATPRIIGGKNAPSGKYPYMVSLRNTSTRKSRHFCGGSIIDVRWILTAAHCVEGFKGNVRYLSVVVGIVRLNCDTGDVYQVERVEIHEGWHEPTLTDDVALIRVERDIEYKEKVQPIRLPTKDFDKVNYPVTMTGWGRWERANESPPNRLQEITLKTIYQCVCKRKFSSVIEITEAHICTFTRYNEGICNGDSGSPLVVNGVQIGVASFVVIPCAVGHPDVFARVYTYVDWINDTMNNYRIE